MLGIALAAAISAADIQAAIGLDPEMCRVVRYAPDGGRSEHPPSRPYAVPTSSHVRVRSGGDATRSVSASSASSGGAGESRAEIDGRKITATYDSKGCHVVIDERRAPG